MSATTTDETPATGRHPVNIGHLVMGLAFLGIVAAWSVFEATNTDPEDARWLLPLPWIFAGTAGLLAVVISRRRRSR